MWTKSLNSNERHKRGFNWIGIHTLLLDAAAAKSLQSCPTLHNPIEGSPSGSTVPGILQARTLERVANSFFNAWKWKVKVKSLSRVWLFATPWTAAYQAPLSMGFSRQEYWSGVPLPSLYSWLGWLKTVTPILIINLKQSQNSIPSRFEGEECNSNF